MTKAVAKRTVSSLDRLEARLNKRSGYRAAKAELSTVAAVASKLIQYRQIHGLSQASLAAKAGLSRKALNEIEGLGNPNPGLKTLESLAKALGLKVGELLAD